MSSCAHALTIVVVAYLHALTIVVVAYLHLLLKKKKKKKNSHYQRIIGIYTYWWWLQMSQKGSDSMYSCQLSRKRAFLGIL